MKKENSLPNPNHPQAAPEMEFKAEQRKPFFWVTVLYGVVGSLAMLGFTPEPYTALIWFLAIFALSVANLVFLVKVVAVTLGLMSHQGTEKGKNSVFHLAVYGMVKLGLLGGILFLVWKGNSAPDLAMYLGLATLIVIPVFGGFWMSQRESALGSSMRPSVKV